MQRGSAQAVSPTSGLHNSFDRATQGLQEVFADEIADEARGPRENEPPSQRDAAGIWHSYDSVKVFGTVLAQ